MKKIILLKKNVSTVEFINFWSNLYNYSDKENIYLKNINSNILNNHTLLLLFKWKNGSRLSYPKQKSFDKNILSKIETINILKSNFNLSLFLKEFNNISTIWKIFLLHIINPKMYPIFDQHVFRAMKYIRFSIIEEIPVDNKHKEKVYFDEYVDFFNTLKSELPENFNNKKIDEALWSIGKFLKSGYKKTLL
jgi:hypothetical protein